MAKVAVAPVSANLTALTDLHVDVKGRPDGFREEVDSHLSQHGGEWELRVQLRTDRDSMPVEDPSKAWSEDESPYVPVARIRVAPQRAWDAQRARAVDDCMKFSVWNGLAAHRPLGAIMRLRKDAYERTSALRMSRAGCPLHAAT